MNIRHLLSTTILMTTAFGGVPISSAYANNAMSPSSGWKVNAVNATAQAAGYCSLTREYGGQVVMTIARNPNNEGSLAMDFTGTPFSKDEIMDVVLTATSGQKRAYKVKPINNDAFVIRVGRDTAFFNALQRSAVLKANIQGHDYSFNVNDIKDGNDKLNACIQTIMAQAPVVQSPEPVSAANEASGEGDVTTTAQSMASIVTSAGDSVANNAPVSLVPKERPEPSKTEKVENLKIANVQEESKSGTEVKKKNEQIARLKEENEYLSSQLNIALKEKMDLQEKVNGEAKKEESLIDSKEKNALEARIKSLESVKAERETQISKLQQELVANLEKQDKALREKSDKIKSLQRQLSKVKEETAEKVSGTRDELEALQKILDGKIEDVAVLQKSLLESEKKIEMKNDEIAFLQKTVDEDKSSDAQAEAQVKELKEKIQKSQEEMEALRADFEEKLAELNKKESVIKSLKEDNQKLLNSKENELTALQGEVGQSTKETEMLRLSLENQARLLNEKDKEIEALAKQVAIEESESQKEVESLRMQIAKLSQDDEKDQKILETLREKNARLNDELKKSVNAISGLMEALKSVENKDAIIAELKERIDNGSKEREALMASLDTQASALVSKDAEIESLMAKVELEDSREDVVKTLKARISDLESEIKTLSDVNKTQVDLIADKDDKIKTFTQQLSLNEEKENIVNELMTQNDQLQVEKSKLETLSKERAKQLEEYEQEIVALHDVLETQRAAEDSLKGKLASTEKSLVMAKEAIADFEERFAVLSGASKEMDTLLSNQAEKLSEKDRHIEILSKDVAELRGERDDLTIALSSGDDRVKALDSKIESLVAERDKAIEERDTLSVAIENATDDFNKEVDNLKEKIAVMEADKLKTLEKEQMQLSTLESELQKALVAANIQEEEAQEEILNLKEENLALVEQIETLRVQVSEQSGVVDEVVAMQAEQGTLKARIEKLTADIVRKDQRIKDMEFASKAAMEIAEDAEAARADMEARIIAMAEQEQAQIEKQVKTEQENSAESQSGVILASAESVNNKATKTIKPSVVRTRTTDALMDTIVANDNDQKSPVEDIKEVPIGKREAEVVENVETYEYAAAVSDVPTVIPQIKPSFSTKGDTKDVDPVDAESLNSIVPAAGEEEQGASDEDISEFGEPVEVYETEAQRLEAELEDEIEEGVQAVRMREPKVSAPPSDAEAFDIMKPDAPQAIAPELIPKDDDEVASDVPSMKPSLEHDKKQIDAATAVKNKNTTEDIAPKGMFEPSVGILDLLKLSGIRTDSNVDVISQASGPSQLIQQWKVGVVYGSSEQISMNGRSMGGMMKSYLDGTQQRCVGEFAVVPSQSHNGASGVVESYELACVGQNVSSSVSLIFFNKGDTFTVIAHEAPTSDMDQAMSIRDKIYDTVVGMI